MPVSKMNLKTFLSLIIVCCVHQTEAGLEFVGSVSVSVSIKETASQLTQIACLECDYDTPNPTGLLSVDSLSISPYTRSFDVFRASDLGLSNTDWCIYYLHGQGTLNYTETQSYTMNVGCTDRVNAVTQDVVINVLTNEPPRIRTPPASCPSISASFTRAGDIVYAILSSLEDPDGDTLSCSMTTVPPSDNFDINPATCEIYAKRDLSSECRRSIDFMVTVTDNHSPPVGPIPISCGFTDYQQPPFNIPNLNTTTNVREDVAIGGVIYTFDGIAGSVLSYTISSTVPPRAYGMFRTDGNKLKILEKLNYEDLQTIHIDLSVDNGACEPVYHYLDIQLVNANDPPVLTPKICFQEVDEGTISVDPRYLCEDEDTGDTRVYSISSGNDAGIFQINSTTGEITASTYTISNNVRQVSHTLQISATDSGGLTDTAILNLNIRDINNQTPYFTDGGSLTYRVSECDYPGPIPGRLMANDDDSDYAGNNIPVFETVKDDCLLINTDGTVHLLKTLQRSETCSLSTKAVDQGFNPRQQSSQVEASVTITSSECPP